MELADKIKTRKAVVSVVGLGYAGLPLAVVFAEEGFRVFGIDVDKARVESINRGVSYIQDVSSPRLTRVTLNSGRPAKLSATANYDAVADSDAIVVCVPTPLRKTKDPDLSHILSAADEIARRLRPGTLVVLESSTYPGTTEELVLPRLQQARGQSFEAGKDFFLAFSPERIDPGQTDWTISNTPKVIGGITPQCTDVAKELYGCVVQEVVTVSSPNVAEMVKLLENTFRMTNVALVNEIAIMCDRLEIDVWEVIDAAKTKPFGFMPFFPGPGLGGHCIPVDPHYLAWKLQTLNYKARFIQLAEEINLGMPLYWVGKVQDALNQSSKPVKGANILVLGVTYKRDVSDIRESPALDVIELLLNKGANATYHDPHVPELKTDGYHLTSVSDSELEQSVASADCVVIVTDHSTYDWEMVRRTASLTVDTRNALGTPTASGPSAHTGAVGQALKGAAG